MVISIDFYYRNDSVNEERSSKTRKSVASGVGDSTSTTTRGVADDNTIIIVGLAAQQAGRPDLIRSRHSHARAYVGGLLNDGMRSRKLEEP